uniref:Alternative protein ZNF592 n=1 Tax=Homo sapiens TaxID=9606 RepID=L8ECE9_HUMAN|nr:alternative protein ZNF592 [Homo sapiens]
MTFWLPLTSQTPPALMPRRPSRHPVRRMRVPSNLQAYVWMKVCPCLTQDQPPMCRP